MDTLAFLQALYHGQHDGYLTLTAIHPSKKHPTPSRHLHITDPAAIQQALVDLRRANQQGWGAYFSVALRQKSLGRWQRGRQADLLCLPALFADLDGDIAAHLRQIQAAGCSGLPPPSAMVGSGRGLHLYWFIQPAYKFAIANHILAGLARQLGGDTLTSANAMRLPDTHNTKPDVQRPCKLLWLAENRRYTLEDFAAYLPPTPEPPRPRAPPTQTYGDLNLAVIHAIEEALIHDLHGFTQPNHWLGSFCPLQHQSDAHGKHFALHPSGMFGVCLGKHRVLKLIDLCRILNIDPATYGGLYRPSMKGVFA